MLVKWIRCNVPENKKAMFSQAQEQWDILKNSDGFLAQVGGWDRKHTSQAAILSFWRDNDAYQVFMEDQHNTIFKENEQESTYDSISVQIYEKLQDINEQDILKLFSKGTILRIADCLVRDEKQDHFEWVQKNIWNVGLKKSDGMLAGVFCKNEKNHPNRYLVVSLWEHIYAHKHYVAYALPSLLEQANVKEDVIQMKGSLVELEE